MEPKTVVVLGGAYGGARAARLLAAGVPEGWRIVLVDRNTHVNHVYIFPRIAVLPGHEHKGFVPFSRIFEIDGKAWQGIYLHAEVQSVHSKHVVLSKSFPEHGLPTTTLRFDYLVYALGSTLPAPLNLWGSQPDSGLHGPSVSPKIQDEVWKRNQSTPYTGTKQEGVSWLKAHQDVIRRAGSVLIVGGGALGTQFATDIRAIHPDKTITLLHSRHRLLPRFDEKMHLEILETLESSNIDVILGERLDMRSASKDAIKLNESRQRVVRTVSGREMAADLILLCTGQKPNTRFLRELDPRTINPHDSLAHVLPTMQLGVLPSAAPSVLSSANSKSLTPPPVNPSDPNGSSASQELEEALAHLDLTSSTADNGEDENDLPENDDQVEQDEQESTPYPHIFVVGDSADAFGAVPAGHTAYYQAEVAARNVLRLIRRDERIISESTSETPTETSAAVVPVSVGSESQSIAADEVLEHYTPGPPSIKVTLGLTKSVYQVNGAVGTRNDGVLDLQAAVVWPSWGYEVKDESDMYA